jgi:hypothetical protein
MYMDSCPTTKHVIIPYIQVLETRYEDRDNYDLVDMWHKIMGKIIEPTKHGFNLSR